MPQPHAPVSIRLAGGIGDHLLGMRTLSLAHARWPDRRIIVYSDCAGDPVPPKVAALSPFAADVIPVSSAPSETSIDVIDASGDDMWTNAAIALRVPVFELLAIRPVLQIPRWATVEAACFLDRLRARAPASASASASVTNLVAVCFAADEPETLRQFQPRIMDAIDLALGAPDAIALNFFTTTTATTTTTTPARHLLETLSTLDARIVPCADLPIEVVAALLRRCSAFVGGDNGLKHLAWALDVPRTFFVKERPKRPDILRWMPDVHCMRSFDCTTHNRKDQP
jgi:Glycosyltransferase family 9 (heptosyltransferase)